MFTGPGEVLADIPTVKRMPGANSSQPAGAFMTMSAEDPFAEVVYCVPEHPEPGSPMVTDATIELVDRHLIPTSPKKVTATAQGTLNTFPVGVWDTNNGACAV
jgi:hypothetical protein